MDIKWAVRMDSGPRLSAFHLDSFPIRIGGGRASAIIPTDPGGGIETLFH